MKITHTHTHTHTQKLALYDYAGEENELSFSANDTIEVLQKDEGGWWQGQLKGKIGMFPR
jgi:hypothetical protein